MRAIMLVAVVGLAGCANPVDPALDRAARDEWGRCVLVRAALLGDTTRETADLVAIAARAIA